MNLKFLLQKKASLISSMDATIKLAEKEDRTFTDEETATFKANKAEVEKIKSQIEMLQGFSVDEEEAPAGEEEKSPAVAATASYKSNIPGPRAKTEFDNIEEFIQCALFKQNDSRLEYREYRSEQSMGTGAKGGFAVPTRFIADIKSINPKAALVRPRATIIPAGTPPDSEISFPALDQEPNGSSNQVFGGVQVYKVSEGGLKTETDANLRMVSLTPQEFAAYITVTDKLMRNWPAASSFVSGALQRTMLGYEDLQFLRGNGIGGPTGAIDHASAYAASRASSNTVGLSDIKELFAHFAPLDGDYSNSVWACSTAVFEKLLDMTGDGGGATNVIKVDQSTQQISLYGVPLVKHPRMRALGSRGDIGIFDFSAYMIKDGSGPIIERGYASGQWERNKSAVKVTWNVDGKPWLTSTYRDEDNVEVSPFCVLAA